MWQITGIYSYGTGYGDKFHYEENTEIIATFDNKQDAENYLQASLLKQPKHNKKYKEKSLLSGCKNAYIEKYCETLPIHNPDIKF